MMCECSFFVAVATLRFMSSILKALSFWYVTIELHKAHKTSHLSVTGRLEFIKSPLVYYVPRIFSTPVHDQSQFAVIVDKPFLHTARLERFVFIDVTVGFSNHTSGFVAWRLSCFVAFPSIR